MEMETRSGDVSVLPEGPTHAAVSEHPFRLQPEEAAGEQGEAAAQYAKASH